jgi:hypothetical protein
VMIRGEVRARLPDFTQNPGRPTGRQAGQGQGQSRRMDVGVQSSDASEVSTSRHSGDQNGERYQQMERFSIPPSTGIRWSSGWMTAPGAIW